MLSRRFEQITLSNYELLKVLPGAPDPQAQVSIPVFANGMARGIVGAEQVVDVGVPFEGGIEDAQGVLGVTHPHGKPDRIHEMHGGQHAARIVAEHHGRNVMCFQHAACNECFHLVHVLPDDLHGGSHKANISRGSRHREGSVYTD